MKKLTILAILPIFIFSVFSTGCMTASQHQQELPQTQEKEMTVGVVQREIYKGMSGADVAEALGSPNIVTKDSDGLETWVYDKIATEASYSSSSAGTGLILSLLVGYNKESGASSTTQKTLTVIIKFKDNIVDSFSYHSSKF